MRDLGVILDDKLTYTSHVEGIVNKAYRNLGFVMRICKPFTDPKCIMILYNAYVRSVLEYCSSVWNPQYVTQEHSIQRIQNKFLKYINKSCNLESDFLNLMYLRDRRVLQDMTFLYDICVGITDCP